MWRDDGFDSPAAMLAAAPRGGLPRGKGRNLPLTAWGRNTPGAPYGIRPRWRWNSVRRGIASQEAMLASDLERLSPPRQQGLRWGRRGEKEGGGGGPFSTRGRPRPRRQYNTPTSWLQQKHLSAVLLAKTFKQQSAKRRFLHPSRDGRGRPLAGSGPKSAQS